MRKKKTLQQRADAAAAAYVPPTGKLQRRMTNNGYLVIEAADVGAVKIITPQPLIPLDKLAAIAIEVLADVKGISSYEIRDVFQRRVMAAAVDQLHGGLKGAQAK